MERMHGLGAALPNLAGSARSQGKTDVITPLQSLSKSLLRAGCWGRAALGCDLVGETGFDVSAMQVSTEVFHVNDSLGVGGVFPRYNRSS